MFENDARKIWEKYTGTVTDSNKPVKLEILKESSWYGCCAECENEETEIYFVITYDNERIKLSIHEVSVDEYREEHWNVRYLSPKEENWRNS